MSESVGVLIAFGAGIISFLSPCVFPIVPSYLSFVTGMSLEDLKEGAERGRTLTYALLFSAGFSLIFVLLGAAASFLGQFFRIYEVWIARIGGAVVIVLGLHLAGVFRIAPLFREIRVHISQRPAGYLGALGVGMAFGAGWTPCIGPQLGAIMTYAATRETFWEGVGLLGIYSAGLAVPLLLTAVAVDRFLVFSQRMRRYQGALQKASGLLLVVLGVLLLTGTFTALTAWLVPFTPDFILERM
jgi:cytochrome c-type biogenesis protein